MNIFKPQPRTPLKTTKTIKNKNIQKNITS